MKRHVTIYGLGLALIAGASGAVALFPNVVGAHPGHAAIQSRLPSHVTAPVRRLSSSTLRADPASGAALRHTARGTHTRHFGTRAGLDRATRAVSTTGSLSLNRSYGASGAGYTGSTRSYGGAIGRSCPHMSTSSSSTSTGK